jgi:uncharacterized protein YbaR (Trm112 family)
VNLNPDLLEILACPACKSSPLRADHAASELVCENPDCGLAYAVRDDIPVLLVEEARRPGENEDPAETPGAAASNSADERAEAPAEGTADNPEGPVASATGGSDGGENKGETGGESET